MRNAQVVLYMLTAYYQFTKFIVYIPTILMSHFIPRRNYAALWLQSIGARWCWRKRCRRSISRS